MQDRRSSGKVGTISQNNTRKAGGHYDDDYISFNVKSQAYFVNRSIIIVDGQDKRIACTNITIVSSGSGNAQQTSPNPIPVPDSAVYPLIKNTTSNTAINGSSVGNGTIAGGASAGRSPSDASIVQQNTAWLFTASITILHLVISAL